MLNGALVLGVLIGLVVIALLLNIRNEVDRLQAAIRRNSQDIRDNSEDIQTSSGLVATHVSHELRTPLTTIMGTLATLEKNYDRIPPDERADMLRAAIQQAGVLESLVAGMISLEPSEGSRGVSFMRRRRRIPKRRRVTTRQWPKLD
jgi:K+-sensing histidine kinase KdpD